MMMNSLLFLFMVTACSYKMFVASGSYCLFLMTLSVLSSCMMFVMSKSFWYCCLLVLIYMGGVYVLLLFVSIYSYNSHSYSSTMKAMMMSTFFSLFFFPSGGVEVSSEMLKELMVKSMSKESLKLLTYNKWVSYLFMLLFMVMSMSVFSFIFKDSSNFLR